MSAEAVYRMASPADGDALTAVWRGSFPEDGEAEIRGFLALLDLTRECAVGEADGQVVSAAMLLPADLLAAEARIPLWCVYAAGTLPAYRGRGLFGGLLRFAQTEASACGREGIFLHPAEESLYAYYARFGFETWFYAPAAGEAPGGAALEPLSVSGYAAAREGLLAGQTHVVWEERFIGVAAGIAASRGGGLFGSGDGAGILERAGDAWTAREWLTPGGLAPGETPVGMLWAGSNRLGALGGGGYMGLTLE